MRRFGGETRDYDVLLVCPEVVLVNETKSRLDTVAIASLTDHRLPARRRSVPP